MYKHQLSCGLPEASSNCVIDPYKNMEISLTVFSEHAFSLSSSYYFQTGCGLFLIEISKQMQCVLWKQSSCLCKSGATAWKLFSI